jgi:hypothetical protein
MIKIKSCAKYSWVSFVITIRAYANYNLACFMIKIRSFYEGRKDESKVIFLVCQTQFHVKICLLFHSISLLHLHENAFQSLQQRKDLPLITLLHSLHATISLSSFCLWGINFLIFCRFSMDLSMPRPQKTLLYYITTLYNKLSFYQQFCQFKHIYL